MKKYGVVLINVLIMLAILAFVVSYTHSKREELIDTRIAAFTDMTVAMGQVTANYLQGEQQICDVWARYIEAADMTMEEAANFVRSSHVLASASAHILREGEDGVFRGISTRPRLGTEDDYAVSYEGIDVLPDPDWKWEIGGGVQITRTYTNPLTGRRVIAFYNHIHLLDEADGTPRDALLLRLMPISDLTEKWVFPREEYESTELSLLDNAGNYIIKGGSPQDTDLLALFQASDQVDSSSLQAWQASLSAGSGSFRMVNARGETCLLAHAPVLGEGNWTIVGSVLMEELSQDAVDWLLVGVVAVGLLVLLAVDLMIMLAFNRRLIATTREAENANRAKTDFLSTMSHDIRTPMNAIIGLTTIAERNVDDAQSVRENLHKINLASNHLLTLINDILDISKVESGRFTLSPVTFSLAETAENLVNISQPMVKAKKIDFRFRTRGVAHELLYADQLRLNQVFINILSNAIKYTEPGGSVQVDLYEQESELPDCVELLYRVQDTGIGMTEEFMKTMYQPFSRQTDSRVDRVQGTGLGLAITKQMVELMNGTIDCKSKPGEGTCFTVLIDIPVADRQPEDMHLDAVEVLVVDDDEVLLETARDTLSSLGAKAETVLSGAEAIDLAARRHREGRDYGVAIIDWKMPDMDGVEVARRIRAETGEELPILLISAYDWSDVEDAAHEAGANGFISKPLFRSKLYEKISELMGTDARAKVQDDDNSDLAGMRVLVAEDNDVNWEIASMLLGMHGIESERAVNGEEAVEMLQKAEPGRYALVFMDIQMPVMNGLDATRAIRALEDPERAAIPIIAITADAFSENVAECFAVGMNGHIAKPIDIKHVLKEIRKVKEGRL